MRSIHLGVLFLAGCVTRAEHEEAMADWARKLAAYQTAAAQQAQAGQGRETTLQQKVAQLDGELQVRDRKIADQLAQLADLQRKLDDATALNQSLGNELQKAGKDVSKLAGEIEDAKQRLEELRKAQAAAQKRADLLRDLLGKFKRMIDAGDLKIVLRDGRMVLQLRNDVLFDSGKTDIKSAGKDALKEVAGVLKTLSDRKLQVAGHTDNVPIQTDRFPSNWELSSARATSVVKFLLSEGISAQSVSAAGYAENDPVNSNDTPEGRAKNRRIEIVLQPNIAELVQIPEGK